MPNDYANVPKGILQSNKFNLNSDIKYLEIKRGQNQFLFSILEFPAL